jgi:hypothetical protein
VYTAEAIKAAGLSLNDVKPTATIAAPSSPLNVTASRSSNSSSSINRNGSSSSSAAAAAAAAAAVRPQKGPSAVPRDAVQPVPIDLSDENSSAATAAAATAATANGYHDSGGVHTKRQRVLNSSSSSSSNNSFPSRSSFVQQQQQQQQQQSGSGARVVGLWSRGPAASVHRAGLPLPNTDSWEVLLLLHTTLSPQLHMLMLLDCYSCVYTQALCSRSC